MFYAVILKYSKKRLVVPAKNVKDHQYKAMINFKFGVKNVEDYVVFCSPIHGNDPDFGQNENLKKVYDQMGDGYYLANVLRVFGGYSAIKLFNMLLAYVNYICSVSSFIADTEEVANAYIERKRGILPVSYATKKSKRVLEALNTEIGGHIQALHVKIERQDNAIQAMQRDMQAHAVTIIIEDSGEE